MGGDGGGDEWGEEVLYCYNHICKLKSTLGSVTSQKSKKFAYLINMGYSYLALSNVN